jgi:hypothetical protein
MAGRFPSAAIDREREAMARKKKKKKNIKNNNDWEFRVQRGPP